jgi:histidinol-phosphatase (PHP family)
MLNAYWDAVMEMIALGGFDILGHLDLVRKNNQQGRWFDTDNADYLRRIEEIASAVSSAGIVVEANTGGINRGYVTDTYPSLSVLRLLCQYKIPVMISADAHRACDLDGHYPQARQLLLDAGYNSHVLFEGRKNGKPIWIERPL